MSIVRMKHLRLLAMQYDRDDLLHALQALGCVEIDEPAVPQDDELFASLAPPKDGALDEARQRHEDAERALEILAPYSDEKKGLLRPRPLLTRQELLDPERLAQGEKVVLAALNTRRAQVQLEQQQAKLEAERAALRPWLELDVPLESRGTARTSVQLGTLPAAAELTAAEGLLQEEAEGLACLWPVSRDQQAQYLMLLCHQSAEESAVQALKSLGWTRFVPKGRTGTAAENDAALRKQLEQIQRELDEVDEQFRLMAGRMDEVRLAADRAAADLEREQSRARLRDTGSTFYLEGWLPADSVTELDGALTKWPCAWETADPTAEEVPRVPVRLKNSPLTRCMNTVTNMYSLPAYDGVDPNPLMFPFFVLFFGVMMADMGYGLLMILGALFVLRRRPREDTRGFMEGVVWCGVSTFVVGAMTGGFFGDFIPQLVRLIDPASTFEMPALFTPLNDTVAIMLGSLVLGAIQVFTGMAVSVVKKIKDGEFIDALFDEITWWIILAGAAMAILGVGSVNGLPAVLLIGCAMLVFGGTRKAKGFGKFSCLVGLVYNGVTGFFSDILSYVRLMALMLSGSVIAQVFNTLGATFKSVPLFIVISLLGNALNLALSLLGCYVHDLRLQCLEFFSRFYKEGGRPYQPLDYDTKYVDVVK